MLFRRNCQAICEMMCRACNMHSKNVAFITETLHDTIMYYRYSVLTTISTKTLINWDIYIDQFKIAALEKVPRRCWALTLIVS